MSKIIHRARWSDEEKLAVMAAYNASDTAEDFFRRFREAVPTAPSRTTKAYLTYLYETVGSDRRPVYEDLCRVQQREIKAEREAVERAKLAKKEADARALEAKEQELRDREATPKPTPTIPDYLKDIEDGPMVTATRAPVSHFAPVETRPKPSPNAPVPRHYRVPVYTQTVFRARDIVETFSVLGSVAVEALAAGRIPSHDGQMRREVFMALHEAMSDGMTFSAACEAVREKFTEKPAVPAESMYAVPATEASVEKGPFAIGKNREAPTLDDPNPDAMEAFTVLESTRELGLTDTGIMLTAINRDGFPAVKIDGKYLITRADLKRVRALLVSGLTIEEALKRAGAPAMGLPVTPPDEDSWTDHLAPLTPEEGETASSLPDVVDRDPVWETVSLEDLSSELHIHVASVYSGVSGHPLVQKHGGDLGVTRQAFDLIEKKWRKCRDISEAFDYAAEKLGVLPPPPPPPTTETGDERQWALEALGEGVFTAEQALKIAGVTDTPRNRWALGLLGRGEITLAQAAKLIR